MAQYLHRNLLTCFWAVRKSTWADGRKFSAMKGLSIFITSCEIASFVYLREIGKYPACTEENLAGWFLGWDFYFGWSGQL